jgi:NADPH:quinone reductase-like Zn-dependent oxidoreductase
VLGGDLAGYVEEADEGSRFKKGDAVAALTPGFWTDTQDGECSVLVWPLGMWL